MSLEAMDSPHLWAQIETEIRRRPRVDQLTIDVVMARVEAERPLTVANAAAPPAVRRRDRQLGAVPFLLAASVALAVGVAVGRVTAPWSTAPAVLPVATPHASRGAELRPVQFVFVARDAKLVTIAGDFNDWNPVSTPMRRAGANGVWSIVLPLRPGRHLYSFVVDGRRWVPDDDAPRAPENEFGGESSVILVERGS